MELSLGPFLTCLMTSLILTIYFYYVLYRKKTFFAQGKRFVFIGVILILLRMAVPLNFPFTYSIYSEHILPTFIGFLYNSTPFHGWSILDILYRIVFIGAVIQLIRLLISKIRFLFQFLNRLLQIFWILYLFSITQYDKILDT